MAIDRIRKAMGYQLPRLGPLGFKLFTRLCPGRIDTELLPGIHTTLDLSDEMQRGVYWQGLRYERETLHTLAEQGAHCERFFDIGANFGFVSYVMLNRCDHMHVYAFEPNPDMFKMMSFTKERNRLARFMPVHAGLGSKAGTLTLHISCVNSGHSTFGPHPDLTKSIERCRNVSVPVLAFDQWCKREGLPSPDPKQWLAKIDVEGQEADVIEGMAESLSEQRFRCVCIELNAFTLSFCGHTPGDIVSRMARFGYNPYHMTATGLSPADPCQEENENVFFMPC